jgi:hypothetical protein
MASAPHLVLDGALCSAAALGAATVRLYVNAHAVPALEAMCAALEQACSAGLVIGSDVELVEAPATDSTCPRSAGGWGWWGRSAVCSPPRRTCEVAAMSGQPSEGESLLVYARAVGGSTPPLPMNPLPDWTVKFFTKLGQRWLHIKLPGPVNAYRAGDGSLLDPELTLGQLGMVPYEMIEFRSA